ncbi:hypothetical protein IV102_19235 [bacterium]|nr:hypothetical protein [bacterium]
MRAHVLTLLALALWSCQKQPIPTPSPTSPADYAFQDVRGPKVDQEISFYEQRCQERPTSWADLALLANAYVAKGDVNPEFLNKGAEAARRSLKIHSKDNPEAYGALAQAAAGRGDYAACWAICQRFPDHPDLLPLGIDCLVQSGSLLLATEWTTRYLKVEKNSCPAVTAAAKVSMLRGRDDVALQLLQSARAQEQPQQRATSAELRYLWGDLHLRHGRLAEARSMLSNSLKIQRRNQAALLALARVEQRDGHPEVALQLLTEAHQFSGHPFLLVEMASIQESLGQTEQAQRLRAQAEPDLAGRELARLHLDQQRPAEALALLQAQEQVGADWRNYQLQARAYEALHKPKEALNAVANALGDGYQEPDLLAQALRLAGQLKDPRAAQWDKQLKLLKAN